MLQAEDEWEAVISDPHHRSKEILVTEVVTEVATEEDMEDIEEEE